jgi:hypothetical protein
MTTTSSAKCKRAVRFVSMSAALSVLAMIAGTYSASAHSKPLQGVPGIKTIVTFAPSGATDANSQAAADELDTAVRMRLNGSGVYETTPFSTFLPSIQRALNVDNTLTQTDVQPPISDPGTAQKIANIMATDGYLLDEVDALKQDPTTQAVSVTVSGNLYFTSNGVSARTFAVTGTAVPTSPTEPLGSLTKRAVNQVADQIVGALGIAPGRMRAALPVSKPHQSVSAGSVALVIVGLALLGVIIHNTTHTSNSSSGGSSSSGSSGSTGGTTITVPNPPTL